MRFLARYLLLPLLAVFAVTVSLALSQVGQDNDPPQVYSELPDTTPAELPFTLFLSANEPVTYQVSYGGQALEQVAQDIRLELRAVAGYENVQVVATDAAANTSSFSLEVFGIPRLEPSLVAPAEALPGEPFTVELIAPETSQSPQRVSLKLGETELRLANHASAVAFAGLPLGTPPGPQTLALELTDVYNRSLRLENTVTALPETRPVEELNLSPSTLSVVTPEARASEREAMARAYAAAEATPRPLWSEAFVLPLEGRRTSGFGSPRRYIRGGNVSYHNGSDLAAATGTPVLATNRGRVLIAQFFPIKGGFTVLDHGAGVYSLYLHQSKLYVNEGDFVERGQAIGAVGSTGLSTGPHLHWEMRVNGIATNPMSWVGKVFP